MPSVRKAVVLVPLLVAIVAVVAATVVSSDPAATADLQQFNAACATDNPYLVTTSYGREGADAKAALTAFRYAPPGSPADHIVLANNGDIGSTYGVAYDLGNNALFVSAYFKRGAPIGPGGAWAVYRVDLDAGNAVSTWRDVASDMTPPATLPSPLADDYWRDNIGKVGLGDIDISEDSGELFVTNLSDRRIYRYSASDGALLGQLEIGSAGETWAADARPFGLKVWGGRLYHGVVDTAESAADRTATISAHVYASDLDGTHMTEVLTFPLNYDRGYALNEPGRGVQVPAKWWPWQDGLSDIIGNTIEIAYPMPMLTDIEFSDDGHMILGFRDRHGDMTFFPGWSVTPPEPNGIAAGDILLAERRGGAWVPPAATEHFDNDFGPACDTCLQSPPANWQHEETSFGGLARIATKDAVVMLGLSPKSSQSGGAFWFDIPTGSNAINDPTLGPVPWRDEMYGLDIGVNFGKANGLGDTELLCAPPTFDQPPLCLGNVVWEDVDNDGLYEPGDGETGIGAVNLTLFVDTDGDGVIGPGDQELATTTTAPDGTYRFCGLAPGNYIVRVDTSNFDPGGPLEGMTNSDGNGTPAPDPDDDADDDDNGDPQAGGEVTSQVITLTLFGEPTNDGDTDDNTNWTVDFGFFRKMCLGNLVWEDIDNDGLHESLNPEPGIGGVALTLYADTDADGALDVTIDQQLATTTTAPDGTYSFCELMAGDYFVRVDPANADPGGPLEGFTNSDGNGVPAPDPDDDVDDDDNGDPHGAGGEASQAVTMMLNTEPVTDGDTDDNTNWTVDFGYFQPPARPMCLGNVVWREADNNGLYEPANGETGIADVALTLYADTDADGTLDPAVDQQLATTTTAADGTYRFCGLLDGDYIVGVDAANVNPGGPLVGLVNVDGNGVPAPDPDDDVDDDDNGDPHAAGGEASQVVTMMLNTEPVTDGDTDDNTNWTVDFGYFQPPTPTPTPPTPATPTGPTPTATPDTGGLCICDTILTRVPEPDRSDIISRAIADPSVFAGYNELLVPGKPYHPIWNPRRLCLNLRSPADIYHHLFNQPRWQVGCFKYTYVPQP